MMIAVSALRCSAPPEKERHQAEGAIAAARAADAPIYAAAELKAAEAALADYDAAVAQRDYRQALRLALEARDGAYDAAKQASNEKAAARSDAERLTAEAQTLIALAQDRLSGAVPPRLTGAAAEHARSALAPAPAALQEARARVEHQDYRGAVATLTPIIEGLREDVAPLTPAGARRGR